MIYRILAASAVVFALAGSAVADDKADMAFQKVDVMATKACNTRHVVEEAQSVLAEGIWPLLRQAKATDDIGRKTGLIGRADGRGDQLDELRKAFKEADSDAKFALAYYKSFGKAPSATVEQAIRDWINHETKFWFVYNQAEKDLHAARQGLPL